MGLIIYIIITVSFQSREGKTGVTNKRRNSDSVRNGGENMHELRYR